MTAQQKITVDRPHVPFGPKGIHPDVADPDYLRAAVRNIKFARCLGSNLTPTVCDLLEQAAQAIEAAALTPAASSADGGEEQ